MAIVLLALLLVSPSLTLTQLVIANNFSNTAAGDSAYFNLNIAVVISIISVIYSYLLSVAYFNARIENEGFDITFSINELSQEGRSRGELLDTVKR